MQSLAALQALVRDAGVDGHPSSNLFHDPCSGAVLPVRAEMSGQAGTIEPLEECLELMTKYHIRHLPVEESEKLVGIVSMRDVMEAIISIKGDRIKRLEKYDSGFVGIIWVR